MILRQWTMDYEQYKGLACEAPCSLYSVLLRHQLIPDPYFGLNEYEATKLCEKGCRFTSRFYTDATTLEKDYLQLHFKGLDTICTISLNGNFLGKVQNMHREYFFDAKSYLTEGENELVLEFDSPLAYFKEANNKHFVFTDLDNAPGAAHLRKTLCMSGWNWAPVLPDMGIFRDVELLAYDTDCFEDFFVYQKHGQNVVTLEISANTKHGSDSQIFAEIDSQRVELKNGKATVTIHNPKLWWVRGYGEQNLYDLKLELVHDKQVIDTLNKRIGLRTLTMSTTPDSNELTDPGREFCFVLNGIKIFTMGANYIPEDSIFPNITTDTFKKLLQQCMDANFNCVRLWGGGYYPSDEFYDLCDEYGLMVWQDFLFGCCNVWMSKKFTEEITAEAIGTVKRLRHHASLALWCGNNENEHFVCDPVNLNYPKISKSLLVLQDYLQLYEHLLPDICEELSPQTFYWPSSPSSFGGLCDPDNNLAGDSHYWSVFCGGAPYQEYRKQTIRFCSEYGFASYPSYKTVRSFCEEKDLNACSRVLDSHQKWSNGNRVLLGYIADEYRYPQDLETVCYASQMVQAEAIYYAASHFRRMRGFCMGSIFWQVNDCWPVVSWSSIDYYGRYKALHYYAKKFYAPVAMGLFRENGGVTVNVANETRSDFSGSITFAICKNDFTVVETRTEKICVSQLSSKDVLQIELPQICEEDTYCYADLFDADGGFIMRITDLFTKPKYFDWTQPNLTITAEKQGDEVQIHVSSDCFARGVFLDFEGFDLTLSDNFFDLTTPDAYTVTVKTDRTPEEILEKLVYKTVYDIGR